MDAIDKLLAIEEIRRLKARYWYALDLKDRAAMRGLFTEDAICDLRVARPDPSDPPLDELPPMEDVAGRAELVLLGAAAISDYICDLVATWVTVHQGHEPIIEITGPDTATGIWPFFDRLDTGTEVFQGHGHYHDDYRLVGGRWLMHRVLITRHAIV